MGSPCILPLLFSGIALTALACGEKPDAVSTASARSTWSAPAKDATTRCADVGDVRVCWGQEAHGTDCDHGICVRAAPLPEVPAPDPLGWRCSGSLTERMCAPRSQKSALFRCAGTRCIEPHPRSPDDGEWSCIDSAGAVVCLGGQTPAGVAVGAPDTAWQCAPRRASTTARPSASNTSETICVDFSPDFPDGVPRRWKCHYDREGVPARVCERDAQAHVLTDVCSADKPCVDGAECVAGRCVPAEPHPSCWLDADCPSRACRFGTCRDTG